MDKQNHSIYRFVSNYSPSDSIMLESNNFANFKILMLDNYDSFTHILADYFLVLGVQIDVRRPDFSIHEIAQGSYSAIVLSPGPGTPKDCPLMMQLIHRYHQKIPMLGVCLGHQALGCYFGANLKKGLRPMHGKISTIKTNDDKIFIGIPPKFNVVRYHSLIIDQLPNSLKALAYTDENELMIFKHKNYNLYGIQFHPEAALTEYGLVLLNNWLQFSLMGKLNNIKL